MQPPRSRYPFSNGADAPVLMTTAAMVVGVVPLLIASGAGAQSRFSIGLVITVGMSVGTLFTLFVVPTIYTYLAADHTAKEQGDDSSEECSKPVQINQS